MKILDRYSREKRRFLENCTRCGFCAQGCPILPYTDLSGTSAEDVQEGVFDFMNDGAPNERAYTKAFACMECFKCTAGMCPEGLNPMLINQLIKKEYIAKGLVKGLSGDAGQPDSAHRVLASIQISRAEYERITTPRGEPKARHVFFPGCNVYFQPEKILNALDILDAIGDDFAFLPGLDHCCGENFLFSGETEKGAQRAEELVSAIARFQPETAVLWCPTCHCLFDKVIAQAMDVPFNILSFPQYLAANMSRLPLAGATAATVTLHEACKSAYTGVDRDGPRKVLRQLPEVTLREMEHHGEETLCCGSGAVCWLPESGARLRLERLREAARTGAERLVTVCHYCNQVFAAEEGGYDFSVVNYVDLVAQAMGIQRHDRFKKYALWGDVKRILADVDSGVAESPFEKGRVVQVLREVFGVGRRK